MALIAFWCKWLGDLIGKFLRFFSDSYGDEIQSLVVVDEDGGLVGTSSSPLPISGPLEIFQLVHDDLNANGNMQVGTVDVDDDNPVLTEEQEVVPTAPLNPSYALSYVGDSLTQVDMTVGAATYRRTHSYTDGLWTAASVWAVI